MKNHIKLILLLVFIILIAIIILIILKYQMQPEGECVEIEEPYCLPLPEEDLEDMAKDIEKDMKEMLPYFDFEYWVEDGCIHTCYYTTEVNPNSSSD